MAGVRLSRSQRWVLAAVERLSEGGVEPATDVSGDLSVCSRNLPATHNSLVRRGLVIANWVPDFGEEAGGYWEYWLTDAGRAALRDGGMNA